ncbi:MAG TPA: ATP-binding protein [Candidatus Nanoarchaeia archaeon]|nr:ATP-binding protein [Candidatus Nanoarchaeia archaeon]
MEFQNRKNELQAIRNLGQLSEEHAHMLVMFGRRRVGKTRLIIESMDSIYFFVDKKTSSLLLREYSDILKTELIGFVPEFSNWDDLVRFLFEYSKENHLKIVFDEFQNFTYVDPAIFSIFQKYWDMYHDHTPILLVFVGSYIGLMKKIFINAKEPLYGRATSRIDLKPLSYNYIRTICQDLGFTNEEEIIALYATFGGVPRYYQLIEDYGITTYEDVIRTLILSENAILKDEVKQILISEFGNNYTTYFSILEAVSFGKGTLKEISDTTGIEMKSLSRYLHDLVNTYEIIERRAPIIKGTKMGRYAIKDQMVHFWFRFINPNMSFTESGKYDLVFDRIKTSLSSFTCPVFEQIARDIVFDNLPFSPVKMGAWWNRRGDEIDIAAIGENPYRVFLGEVKWNTRPLGVNQIKKLLDKRILVDWYNNEREEHFLMVSKAGFTKSTKDFMNDNKIEGWDLAELLKKMK